MDASTFGWDLAIAIVIVAALSIAILCIRTLRKKPSLRCTLSVGLLLLCSITTIGVISYGSFVEPQLITVTRRASPFPIDQGLHIAVISDLHAGPYKDAAFTARLVREINALLPDVILIAGDSVLGDAEEIETQLAPLKGLHANLGVYAVLGNHDYGIHRGLLGLVRDADQSEIITAVLQSLGVTVLQNEHTVLHLGVSQVALAGITDIWSQTSDVPAALEGITPAMPTILLSHNPDAALLPGSNRTNLIIAGHTHGGQIRLPFIGPIVPLPTHLGQQYGQGIFSFGTDRTLAITRGVGESGPRARLFAPPEILFLTLQPTLDPLLVP